MFAFGYQDDHSGGGTNEPRARKCRLPIERATVIECTIKYLDNALALTRAPSILQEVLILRMKWNSEILKVIG